MASEGPDEWPDCLDASNAANRTSGAISSVPRRVGRVCAVVGGTDKTGIAYVSELRGKYAPGAPVADTPYNREFTSKYGQGARLRAT